MVLKLTSDEVSEVSRALSAAYSEVLRELGRVAGFQSPEQGLELCHRKWKLEAMLHQIDHSEEPPPVLELVPASRRETPREEAA